MAAVRALLTLAALVLCGCGGGSDSAPEPPTAASSPPGLGLVVIGVKAVSIGTGCYQSPIVRGTRLDIEDGDGKTLTVVKFAKTPGTASCHWTAIATLPVSDIYRLSTADDGTLVTVSRSEVHGGHLNLHVDFRGSVSVS